MARHRTGMLHALLADPAAPYYLAALVGSIAWTSWCAFRLWRGW